MIVHRKAPQPGDGPPRRDGQGEDVSVRGERQAADAEERGAGGEAAEHAAGRRQSVPHLQDLQRPARAQLLRMVEKQMDEMTTDDAAQERPGRERVHRRRVQSFLARAAQQEDGSKVDTGGREYPEGLHRERADAQRRDLEVWDQ